MWAVGSVAPSPGAYAGKGRAQSRCRCARNALPAAHLHVCRRVRLTAHHLHAQIPVQMWAGVSPVPVQMWAGMTPVPAQLWQGGAHVVPAPMWAGPPPGSGRGGAPAAARRCSSAGRDSGLRPARGSLATVQRCASRVAALQGCNAATKPQAAAEAQASASVTLTHSLRARRSTSRVPYRTERARGGYGSTCFASARWAGVSTTEAS
jgi:hypothetical protein